MKVYFSDEELRAVKRSLKSSIDLYSRAVNNAQTGGPLYAETSSQKFSAYSRHLSALRSAIRRLTPQGGAIQ